MTLSRFGILGGAALLLAGCAGEPAPPPSPRPDIVSAINSARVRQGLPHVMEMPASISNARASGAWRYREGSLASGHRGFAAAVTASPLQTAWSGEALFSGPARSSAADIVATWMSSPGHRAILLRPGAEQCAASSAADQRFAVVALVCGGRL